MTDYPISKLTDTGALVGTEAIEVSELSASVTITAATISALASDNSYNDSANGFIAAGFAVNNYVRVQGFTGNTANNIYSAKITALTAGKMTIGGTDGNVIVDDAAGESVTISKWESKRSTTQDIANLNSGGTTGRLIGRQVITATGAGTYTPTAGTGSIVIEMVGGGGGGGGCGASGANQGSRSTAGGGGAYLMKRLTANFSGASYSVGTGGNGGTAGANNGSDGGDTTFTDTAGSPTVYTAGKGIGGTGAAAIALTNVSAGVTAGGTATNGDVNVPGGSSDIGAVLVATGGGWTGAGGRSRFSPGAPATRSNAAGSTAGTNATGYGGGGGAGYSQNSSAAAAGGNGSSGILIIWEYSS